MNPYFTLFIVGNIDDIAREYPGMSFRDMAVKTPQERYDWACNFNPKHTYIDVDGKEKVTYIPIITNDPYILSAAGMINESKCAVYYRTSKQRSKSFHMHQEIKEWRDFMTFAEFWQYVGDRGWA